MEFKKLSDVDLVDVVSDDTNVLIEENGEIKKVSKSGIGAQADWNETNEANPAFILNKPTSLGGYAYYAMYSSYIVKCDTCEYPVDGIGESTVTVEEFVADYKSKPIMVLFGKDDLGSYNGPKPIVNCYYDSYYANRLNLVYFEGYSSYSTYAEFVE